MAQTLSELLGIELQPVYSIGEQALMALAEKYPDEMDYDEGVISFCTEDLIFNIETDENEKGKAVYKATCMSFAPKTLLFDTGWSTLAKTMVSLRSSVAAIQW